jgi:hypothetical protein
MKKIYLTILILVLAAVGYFFNMNQAHVEMPKNNEPVGVIWKGLGFEPGFYFEISGMVGDSRHTKLALQEGGEVEGDLLMLTTPGVIFHVKGDLLVGGDAAVPTDIQIKETACTKPSGEDVKYSVTMNYADMIYKGCAEKVN